MVHTKFKAWNLKQNLSRLFTPRVTNAFSKHRWLEVGSHGESSNVNIFLKVEKLKTQVFCVVNIRCFTPTDQMVTITRRIFEETLHQIQLCFGRFNSRSRILTSRCHLGRISISFGKRSNLIGIFLSGFAIIKQKNFE